MTGPIEVRVATSDGRARCAAPPALASLLRDLLGVADGAPLSPHDGVARLLAGLEAPTESLAPAVRRLIPHLAYYREKLAERAIDPTAIWSDGGAAVPPDDAVWLEGYLPEFVAHLVAEAEAASRRPGVSPLAVSIFDSLVERAASQSAPRSRALVPRTVLGLPSEANLAVLMPWFEASLDIPGDVCEFGCFRGVNSVKFAFMLRALGLDKTVYAFDTFEGFAIADPGGGALGVGAFSDNHEAFDDLTKWSAVLPIVPVKGDATVTCASIARPLSFVWLDLDMAVLLDPVLRSILRWIGPQTIVGIDDVGRPETPTVLPWVEAIVADGLLTEIGRDEAAFMRFYRRG